jgi:hypothetical protein
MEGAWFEVEVSYNSRRRSGWSKVDSVSNVHAAQIKVPGIHVGDHGASTDVSWLIPGSKVPLVTSPDYAYEDTGFWLGSSPAKLSSKNMEVNNDGLLEAKDVTVAFHIGDAPIVSVLATEDGTGQLVLWEAASSYGGLGGASINSVVRGSVPAAEMLSQTKSSYNQSILESRILMALVLWLGTYLAIYPEAIAKWLFEKRCEFRAAWRVAISVVWSLLWSCLPIASAFLLSWLGFRFPAVFLVAGGVVIPCLIAATCCFANCFDIRNVSQSENDELEEEDEEDDEDDSGLYQLLCGGVACLDLLYIATLLLLCGLATAVATSTYIYFIYMPLHRNTTHVRVPHN